MGGWGDRVPVEAALLVLVLGLILLARLYLRRGRDRRFEEQIPGLVPLDDGSTASAVAAGTLVPLVGLPATAVDFVPQAGVRPAEWGVLLTERVTVEHVTATIVDLAVRGHLRLERVERARRFHRPEVDWVIHRAKAPVDDLVDYEAVLLRVLLRDAESVHASALREGFVGSLLSVRELLYARMSERGWFVSRPDRARTTWARRGRWMLLGGLVGAFVLAIIGSWWPVALAVSAVGLALVVAARWMPARTARGHASKVRAEGFALYLRTAEVEQISAEERLGVFSRYLPFAIVLGAATHWTKVFGDAVARGLVPDRDIDWLMAVDVVDAGLDLASWLPDDGADLVSGLSSGITDALDGMAGLDGGGLADGLDAVLDAMSSALDGLDLLP